jgi:hypothetical protein
MDFGKETATHRLAAAGQAAGLTAVKESRGFASLCISVGAVSRFSVRIYRQTEVL